MGRWSHDIVLSALETFPEPLGSLVAAFPGSAAVADNPGWLDAWFANLVEAYAQGNPPPPLRLKVSGAEDWGADLTPLARTPVQPKVRLLRLTPHYFRGFRAIPNPIDVDSDLVVIEGTNSSGKTGLAEAIEWVLTGSLSRRSSGQYGNSRELANCITNEFRPADERTWVELLMSVDAKPVLLRRTLTRDYSTKQGSQAESVLTCDGVQLDRDADTGLFAELFGGLHPILMQHTLRQFVNDQPEARRRYFETLLQIDELTELIARAVVGDASLETFKSKTGTPASDSIASLIKSTTDPQLRALLSSLRDVNAAQAQDKFRDALVVAAISMFPSTVGAQPTFTQCRDGIDAAQAAAREAQLPILGILREPLNRPLPDIELAESAALALSQASKDLATVAEAAEELDSAKIAAARAFHVLVDAGLADSTQEGDQECPICLDPRLTLGPERVRALGAWTPMADVLTRAKNLVADEARKFAAAISELQVSARRFGVPLPSDAELQSMLRTASTQLRAAVLTVVAKTRELARAAEDSALSLGRFSSNPSEARSSIADLSQVHQTYRDAMGRLEGIVGATARDDPSYLARERWLSAASTLGMLAAEITWNSARRNAQECLSEIRKNLIKLRSEIIEDARRAFSQRITEVWQLLRRDSGAKFSQLNIPPARGKGYKLEL